MPRSATSRAICNLILPLLLILQILIELSDARGKGGNKKGGGGGGDDTTIP